MKPEELLYTQTHEWVFVETDPSGEKVVTVGLSDFALELLTDLVFINLPSAGTEVRAGEPLGEVESVKAVSDIYSPLDGAVIQSNTTVADNLDVLSSDPYGKGWLVKVKVSNDAALANLLDHAAYRKQCGEEDH